MSRTHKIQTMHEYHQVKGGRKGCGDNPFHNTGAAYRYGNNRHMWANLKVKLRRIEKRKPWTADEV